jgi:ribosome-associated translation inhibitor RaiA
LGSAEQGKRSKVNHAFHLFVKLHEIPEALRFLYEEKMGRRMRWNKEDEPGEAHLDVTHPRGRTRMEAGYAV